MDNLDLILPPELETALNGFYSTPEPDATFASRLELELRRRQMDLLRPVEKSRFPLWTKRNSFMQTLRARPALVILLILLALGLLTSVAYAVSRSLGYVPGVGLVDQEYGIRVLSEPVSAGKDQITVTVTKVVADASRTFVTYQVDGIPSTYIDHPICVDPPGLQLPDGRKLDFLGGGAGGMESESGKPMTFETSYTFPAIPAEIKTIIFLSPCDQPAISLQLVAAPAGFATPATEIGATYEASSPNFISTPSITSTPLSANARATEPAPANPATSTRVPGASGLSLDKVIEMKDAYVLIGNFSNKDDLPGPVMSSPGNLYYDTKITDGQGESVDFQLRSDLIMEPQGNSIGWAYEIPKPVKGPLTITLASVPVLLSDNLQIPLDVGQNPQPDQKWELNRTANLRGHDFVIDDITALKNGYAIHLHSNIDLPELSFQFDLFPPVYPGGTGMVDHRKQAIVYGQSIIFDGTPPAGNLTFSLISFETVQLPGPWTLTWSPPAGK